LLSKLCKQQKDISLHLHEMWEETPQANCLACPLLYPALVAI